ncbi:SemiSWEET transporter [Niveibacterium umoris]|uniref:MtN3 and saliva related transmembrane protein n=1 Tax=Niveibacterium umoris TaxID=1193620 RepID=A0A840BEI5_9RHOO|nr:SemiSWEET transporter [Niveibacterium umoris]MBB4011941.1 MtN3 and saliva related transmembrane protein [Niveibacterium umoris]
MSPLLVDVLGYIAATLTTVAFVPQAWLTWKTRSAHGVSLGMYCVFVAGIVMWLVYGLFISAWPVVIANVVTLALASFILAMKIRYG